LAEASAAGADRVAAAIWRPLSDPDVEAAVTRLRTAGASLVAVSGHDSTAYTMRRFAAAFGPRFRQVQVGEEIRVDGRS
jgi:7,8-dihydropterin-6-yl-methyl-4-(beta-D-ribofuranosyl)aminobenzene 5'-phosphate synthase